MTNAPSEPREWTLHGITRIHRDIEIGEVSHCTYGERVIGPKIGDATVDVIEKFAFLALKAENEKLRDALFRISITNPTAKTWINGEVYIVHALAKAALETK